MDTSPWGLFVLKLAYVHESLITKTELQYLHVYNTHVECISYCIGCSWPRQNVRQRRRQRAFVAFCSNPWSFFAFDVLSGRRRASCRCWRGPLVTKLPWEGKKTETQRFCGSLCFFSPWFHVFWAGRNRFGKIEHSTSQWITLVTLRGSSGSRDEAGRGTPTIMHPQM